MVTDAPRRCIGFTKDGQPCQAWRETGSVYCWLHNPTGGSRALRHALRPLKKSFRKPRGGPGLTWSEFLSDSEPAKHPTKRERDETALQEEVRRRAKEQDVQRIAAGLPPVWSKRDDAEAAADGN